MKLYLDTSTMTAHLRLDDHAYDWDGGREMAEGLHRFIHDKLIDNHCDWQDITEISFYSGPGSFTGLRIGAAIVNSLAHELHVPLYDHHGNQHEIIIPDYGRNANITTPRK